MAKPQKQAVYLSCMSLFRGENAKLRKLKGIKKILLLKQNSPIIGSLKQSHSFEQICDVVKELLEQGIFESTIKAKLCFPNLFQISPDRTAQRAESEAEAARSEAEAIEEAISSDDEAMVVPEEAKAEEQGNIPRTGLRSQSNAHQAAQPTTSKSAALATKSLYPLYLPYRTQHRILCTVQSILEEACFDFGKATFPELVSQKRWDCPESGELTEWVKVLRSRGTTVLKSNTRGLPNESWKELLKKTSQLRHTAVHRLRTTATGTKRLLESGRALLEALNDEKRAACIRDIEAELILTIDEMERNTSLLEAKMEKQQIELAERRAELDRLEQQMIEDMLSDDVENRSALGSALESLLLERVNRASLDQTLQEAECQEEGGAPSHSEPDVEDAHVDKTTEKLQAIDEGDKSWPGLAAECSSIGAPDGIPDTQVHGDLASPDCFAELKSLEDEYHDADEGNDDDDDDDEFRPIE